MIRWMRENLYSWPYWVLLLGSQFVIALLGNRNMGVIWAVAIAIPVAHMMGRESKK